MELAARKTVTVDTELDVYLATPANPWQCSTNESTNRLLCKNSPK